jgi:hypothetical protein
VVLLEEPRVRASIRIRVEGGSRRPSIGVSYNCHFFALFVVSFARGGVSARAMKRVGPRRPRDKIANPHPTREKLTILTITLPNRQSPVAYLAAARDKRSRTAIHSSLAGGISIRMRLSPSPSKRCNTS